MNPPAELPCTNLRMDADHPKPEPNPDDPRWRIAFRAYGAAIASPGDADAAAKLRSIAPADVVAEVRARITGATSKPDGR